MSTANNVLATGSQSITNYDTSKIFIFDNEYMTGTMANDTYDDAVPGTVLGRIASSGNLVPLDTTASDGSQFPVGILVNQVDAGDSKNATFCIAGEVDQDSVVMHVSGQTLNTVVSDRRISDRLMSDTKGIKLVSATQLSKTDNQ